MKKQFMQFGVIAVVLVACIIGYFVMSHYFEKAEKEEEEANKIVAFTLNDYKDTKEFSYVYDGGTITLKNNGGTWNVSGKDDVKVDSSVVETEMLAQLVEVTAEDKINDADSKEDYGFSESDGELTAATNTIKVKDKDGTEYVIYIGNANPYDSTLYYMMVKGDDNVYVVSSTVVDAFSKSVEDIQEEETTTEEVTTVEKTSEEETTVETTEE